MTFSIRQIIPIALKYYDAEDDITKIIHNSTYSIDQNSYIISGYANNTDAEQKLLFTANYEIIGLFDSLNYNWQWAWASAQYDIELTKTSRNILNYGLDLSITEFTGLKLQLITSKFKIVDLVQIDIFISLFAYLCKNRYIIHTSKYNSNKTQYIKWYIALKNIQIMK